jgi:hypothetical protein
MKKKYVWAAGLVTLVASPLVFAQQATPEPLPASVLGPQLVAWSQMQKPQPAPAPMPADQSQPVPPQAQQQQQNPPAQAITGTIVKDGNKYVLKGSDNTVYQIDDQEKAKLYEGKQVKVAGSIDAKTNVLHVTSIELLS